MTIPYVNSDWGFRDRPQFILILTPDSRVFRDTLFQMNSLAFRTSYLLPVKLRSTTRSKITLPKELAKARINSLFRGHSFLFDKLQHWTLRGMSIYAENLLNL